LEQSVRISKSELEAFLSELTDFIKRYERVLSDLDLARAKEDAVRNDMREDIERRMSKSREALTQIRRSIDKLCEQTEEILTVAPIERA
jgi:Asp-tRNA(Asn)/Glu-tRNA(Gln) amidotransferase C subunit